MPSLWADSLDEHRALVLGRVLDAFGELHAERSFDAITLSAVAERAGIARSALYNYVADKHELAMAYTERTLQGVVAQMVADVRSVQSARGQVQAYLTWTLRHFAQTAGAGDDLMPLLSPDQQGRLLGMLAPLRDLLAEVIADGVASGELAGDVDALCEVVWAALGGLRMPVARGELDPAVAAAQLGAVLLDGMTPR